MALALSSYYNPSSSAVTSCWTPRKTVKMSSETPDYYAILGISSQATHDEIRKAYKIQALKTHPDRVPSDSPERPSRTKRFQAVNDAFYVLSDTTRRQEYDRTRFYAPPKSGWQDAQFGDIFEEMMNDEGMRDEPVPDQAAGPMGKMYGILGGVSGACIGFIVANFPGAMAGAVAGNRLGNIRDTRGKSVYEVFQTLPQGEKGRLLTELFAKLVAQAVSI